MRPTRVIMLRIRSGAIGSGGTLWPPASGCFRRARSSFPEGPRRPGALATAPLLIRAPARCNRSQAVRGGVGQLEAEMIENALHQRQHRHREQRPPNAEEMLADQERKDDEHRMQLGSRAD